jgi:hypothetical protein
MTIMTFIQYPAKTGCLNAYLTGPNLAGCHLPTYQKPCIKNMCYSLLFAAIALQPFLYESGGK